MTDTIPLQDQIRHQLLAGVIPTHSLPPIANGVSQDIHQRSSSPTSFSSSSHKATGPAYKDLVRLLAYERDPSDNELSPDLSSQDSNDLVYYAYLQGDYNLITSSKIDSEFKYLILLKSVYESLANPNQAKFQSDLFEKWCKLNKFPKLTSLESWRYVGLICSSLSSSSDTIGTLDLFDKKLDKLMKSNSVFSQLLKYIISYNSSSSLENSIQSKITILQSFTTFSLKTLSTLKFPKASQRNLEVSLISQTALYLSTHTSFSELPPDLPNEPKKLDIGKIVQNSLQKSYQDIPTMRLWLVEAVQDGPKNLQKAIASFKVYLEYIHDDKIQHQNQYGDILDVIETYRIILRFMSGKSMPTLDLELFNQYQHWLFELIKLVELFLTSMRVDKLTKDEYSPELCIFLIDLWYDVAQFSRFTCLSRTVTKDVLKDRLASTNLYFENAHQLIEYLPLSVLITKKYGPFYYDYAVSLIKLGNNQEALKSVRKALKIEPDSIQYLNLTCLLYSTFEETKTKAYNIADQVVGGIHQELDSITNPEIELDSDKKYDRLQMFMTYLALIESQYGLSEALRNIDELFNLVYRLMGGDTPGVPVASSPSSSNSSGAPRHSVFRPSIIIPRDGKENMPIAGVGTNGHKRNESKTGSGLKRTFTNTVSTVKKTVGHKPSKSTASSNTRKRLELSGDENKILQEVWLFASKMYERDGNLVDAEQCIKDSETVYKPTYLSHARMGQLALTFGNYKMALKELELSLDLNDSVSNYEGVIGFSNLILTPQTDVFISAKDKESALARAKNYLESLVSSYEWFQRSELYLQLGLLWEQAGNQPQMEHMLWLCVALENNKAVRALVT